MKVFSFEISTDFFEMTTPKVYPNKSLQSCLKIGKKKLSVNVNEKPYLIKLCSIL